MKAKYLNKNFNTNTLYTEDLGKVDTSKRVFLGFIIKDGSSWQALDRVDSARGGGLAATTS